jgi:hypothetical protein
MSLQGLPLIFTQMQIIQMQVLVMMETANTIVRSALQQEVRDFKNCVIDYYR